MTQAIVAAIVVFGIAVAAVFFVPVIAHLWRSREKQVLAGGCVVACLLLFASCVTLVASGGREARLTISNESPWPLEISAVNVKSRVIEPGESYELYVDGGPGWVNGLIDDIEILGGADLSTRVIVRGLIEGSSAEITVRAETFSPATTDR